MIRRIAIVLFCISAALAGDPPPGQPRLVHIIEIEPNLITDDQAALLERADAIVDAFMEEIDEFGLDHIDATIWTHRRERILEALTVLRRAMQERSRILTDIQLRHQQLGARGQELVIANPATVRLFATGIWIRLIAADAMRLGVVRQDHDFTAAGSAISSSDIQSSYVWLDQLRPDDGESFLFREHARLRKAKTDGVGYVLPNPPEFSSNRLRARFQILQGLTQTLHSVQRR